MTLEWKQVSRECPLGRIRGGVAHSWCIYSLMNKRENCGSARSSTMRLFGLFRQPSNKNTWVGVFWRSCTRIITPLFLPAGRKHGFKATRGVEQWAVTEMAVIRDLEQFQRVDSLLHRAFSEVWKNSATFRKLHATGFHATDVERVSFVRRAKYYSGIYKVHARLG